MPRKPSAGNEIERFQGNTMCGLAGFSAVPQLTGPQERAALERMLVALWHRGPDDRGLYLDSHAALAHARLSIIDLSLRGRQPMASEDGRVQVAFNGEIYNFRELQRELRAAGHPFASDTDTEVLVQGYLEWGLQGLLERIEGMFAFALWDAAQAKLFLARDPFGIKPLYYAERRGRLIFGSEMKALIAYDESMPEIDKGGLLQSFHYIGVPAPRTVYKGYRQLEPATWLCFDCRSAKIERRRYWAWKIKPEIGDSAQAAKLAWEAIVRNVEEQLIADVPVGIFLSGGLDSSLIAAACAELGRKPTCLTIALPDTGHDESPYAEAVARHFGLPHWIEPMGMDAARPFDAQLGRMFDEPFASSAALSSAYIAKLAARKFKVMLSGDGGDELFGGYRWYGAWVNWYGVEGKPVPLWRRPGNGLRALLGRPHMPADPISGYARLMRAFTRAELKRLFDSRLLARHRHSARASLRYREIDDPHLKGYDRLQQLDMQIFLPTECLPKVDRTSMAHSLEIRVPLLDRRLAELIGRIDVNTRNPNAERKALLKRIAREKLPAEVVEKRKQGFSTPVRRWFPASMILAEIENDLTSADFWRGIFSPDCLSSAARLKGRPLWRFWHTWRFVKRHVEYRSAAA
jgi:asparagine synthase (glutamine-hydrolysing)